MTPHSPFDNPLKVCNTIFISANNTRQFMHLQYNFLITNDTTKIVPNNINDANDTGFKIALRG